MTRLATALLCCAAAACGPEFTSAAAAAGDATPAADVATLEQAIAPELDAGGDHAERVDGAGELADAGADVVRIDHQGTDAGGDHPEPVDGAGDVAPDVGPDTYRGPCTATGCPTCGILNASPCCSSATTCGCLTLGACR